MNNELVNYGMQLLEKSYLDEFVSFVAKHVEDTEIYFQELENAIIKSNNFTLYNTYCLYCIKKDILLNNPLGGLKLLTRQNYDQVKNSSLNTFVHLFTSFKSLGDEKSLVKLFSYYKKEDIISNFKNSKNHYFPSIEDQIKKYHKTKKFR